MPSRPTAVLHVENGHVDECGAPPNIQHGAETGLYVGYFESSCGDQWTVEIDREAGTGVLRGGDVGWKRRIRIADNRIDGGPILGDKEFAWLALCWKAATGRALEKPPMQVVKEIMSSMTEAEAQAINESIERSERAFGVFKGEQG
jgi:hypothetical protein